MQQIVFEFETEKECRDVADKLWYTHSASGEMVVRALAAGRWHLELLSEKELRDSVLEKFAQWRAEPGD